MIVYHCAPFASSSWTEASQNKSEVGVCFGNPTTARSAQICFVLQHYSAVYTLQSLCLGQALKGQLDHHARKTSTEVQNLAQFLLSCVSVSTEVGVRGCIRVVLSVLTPCAECGASCSVLTLHWQPWVRLAYITITKDSRIVQSIWISFWHDCKLYNSNSRDDPKWENCVSLYESQNIVRVLTNDVDVDDGDNDDECKNRVDRVKAGTESALQYIDASNSYNIKLMSILHCTEKKTWDLHIYKDNCNCYLYVSTISRL